MRPTLTRMCLLSCLQVPRKLPEADPRHDLPHEGMRARATWAGTSIGPRNLPPPPILHFRFDLGRLDPGTSLLPRTTGHHRSQRAQRVRRSAAALEQVANGLESAGRHARNNRRFSAEFAPTAGVQQQARLLATPPPPEQHSDVARGSHAILAAFGFLIPPPLPPKSAGLVAFRCVSSASPWPPPPSPASTATSSRRGCICGRCRLDWWAPRAFFTSCLAFY